MPFDNNKSGAMVAYESANLAYPPKAMPHSSRFHPSLEIRHPTGEDTESNSADRLVVADEWIITSHSATCREF